MSSREPSGESNDDKGTSNSKWTRRFSYDEMIKRLSTKRQPRRRLSDFELSRRVSSIGTLLLPVDIYDSDGDDVPEIDHSGPIHFTKRPLPLKHVKLPYYEDLQGNYGGAAAEGGLGLGRFLPDITKKTSRKGRRMR